MAYTYEDLLRETEQKKREAIKQFNKALSGKAGFLAKAEIERNPGMVAWPWLAKDFCEKLAAHVGEWTSCEDGSFNNDDPLAWEIGNIYMAYEDNDPGLYDLLPVEAQLFAEEA